MDINSFIAYNCGLFRLVDGTLEKICGEFIDHEKSVFLLALHGSDPAIGGYD